jgi:hypothetical protein
MKSLMKATYIVASFAGVLTLRTPAKEAKGDAAALHLSSLLETTSLSIVHVVRVPDFRHARNAL